VIDASGSMARDDRMPLVKYALKMLTERLNPSDWVSIVTYGTEASLVTECVAAEARDEIVSAIEGVKCGGSTNMMKGLELGYSQVSARAFGVPWTSSGS
ncbi:MAG: VWA domain-containing protein, partial [Aquiluna sp.]